MTASIQPFWLFLAANGLVWLVVLGFLFYFLRRRREEPERFLRTPEAARFLGLSDRTLEKHRIFGTGPMYQKLGGRVVYRIKDLTAWANTGRRKSTTEMRIGGIPPIKRRNDPAGKGSGA
ncbi:helix-turn-helix transcriptional regulator [Asticcacaulis taihuensis]|uniref:helix-turn-helix transcriptional regulator n=1 Tax=Asticcacaulis taihuensis TaxID=260084 RepID=UPI003F68D82C